MALEHGARDKLVRIIEREPGCHLRGLQRRTGFGLGQLRHHLRALETAGLVVRQVDGRRHRFYLAGAVPTSDRDIHEALYQEVPRRILSLLVNRPGPRHVDLTRVLERPPATVSYHLARLQAAGLVKQETKGNVVRYHVVAPERIGRLLREHPSTRRDAVARGFMDTFGPLLD